MTIKIQAPTMGESISEATVANWSKQVGEYVNEDEIIAELETDKVNLEVTAPKSGVLSKIVANEGENVTVGDLLGEIDEAASKPEVSSAEEAPSANENTVVSESVIVENIQSATNETQKQASLSPAVRRLVEEEKLDASQISGTGKDGRLTKGDVLNHLKNPVATNQTSVAMENNTNITGNLNATSGKLEERVPMTRLRKVIAGRLKTSQNTAAMLTTYNEVDLSAVMELRKTHQEKFVAEHGVKLGYMSFFTKAVIESLKEFTAINAEIDGEDIVYKKYYNIGIAVSSERGLVVPVLKGADQMSFAEIEQNIKNYAFKARDGKLMPDDMAGGTFTITNGGTFGSLMSMPILNYPQSGILGMHNIVERPVAVNGEVVIRPMMYIALTYDHRIVDGKGAVSFLVKLKQCLEDPARLLLNI